MTVSIIAAMGQNRVIGKDGDLPWHIPEDLKWFKKVTMGKPVVMGRKTFETLNKPLPGRQNIILTGNADYEAAECTVVHSLEEALKAARDAQEVMICGGASVYHAALQKADKMYLTLIYDDFVGDTFFPEYDLSEWREIERTDRYQKNNGYEYSFVIYERKHS